MLRVNLKALLELSKSEEKLQMHKRIKDAGKVSYMVCFELQDGILTMRRVRRLTMRARKRPRRYRTAIQRHQTPTERPVQTSVMSQTSFVERVVPLSRILDAVTQTLSLERRQVGVDTVDLSMQINRYQQTTIKTMFTTSSQTKQSSLETRSTQMEHDARSRWTQTDLKNCVTSMVGTQTFEMVQSRHSCCQTNMSEDTEMMLTPYLEMLKLLLSTSSNQGQLLISCLEAVNQLVDFKHLELQKQRLDAAAKLDKETQQAEIAKTQMRAPSAGAIKAKQLFKIKQLYLKRALLRCRHRCCGHLKRRRTKPVAELEEAVTQTEALITPTACSGTQTKQVLLAVANTQTDKEPEGNEEKENDKEKEKEKEKEKGKDKEKGFPWLQLKK